MWKTKIQQYWEKDPLTVIAVATGAVVAATGVFNALSAAQGRRAYAKQINYKIKNKK